MITTQSRLAYFIEHKPIRNFVIDDFRDPRRETEITAIMPDYTDFCEKRKICRTFLKSVIPELRALYQEPLLSKIQEQHLFRQFNYYKFNFIKVLDPYANFNEGIVEYSELRSDIDIAALENYYFLATQVKQLLISCNARLVSNIAKKQKELPPSSLDGGIELLADIMADGNIGLIRAVDYFDFRMGFKFSTYATWAIIAIINKTRKKNRRQAETVMTGCDFLLEQSLDDRELLGNEQKELNFCVSKALKNIDQRQQWVLRAYYEQGRRLQAIADDLSMSKERVRQLRDKGLLAIKKKLKRLGFDEFDELYVL